jgi:ABC-2 type transport system ATP-binding protein
MTETAIEVKNLTKEFGKLKAVDNISFKIKRGCVFGFLGPNGAGKSTTIRILCGVLHPTLGSVEVFRKDVIRETEAVRHDIGYMSQKFGLYEDLTVEENLEFYAAIYGLKQEEIDRRKEELINLANLKGKEKALAAALSGGLKQRLALICALIHSPKLLILDEPTAGVDPVSRRVFWQIIKDLSAEGITILVTTHYMDEAELCDIVAFIFKGRLINIGLPSEIIRKEEAGNLEDVFVLYMARYGF